MSAALTLNPATEIRPAKDRRSSGEGAVFDVEVAQFSSCVRATAYQVGLLEYFSEPTTAEQILKRFPFAKSESAAFIEECRAAAVLVEKLPDGRLVLPSRVKSKTTFLSTPDYDPGHPPAFVILGVPYDGATSGEPGTRFGPAAVRHASEGYRFQIDPATLAPAGFLDLASGRTMLQGIEIADAGDIRVDPGEAQEDIFRRTTEEVRSLAEAGCIPLVIGGDHAITYPVLAGLPVEELAIVHLDAHTDLAPSSGDLHHGNVFTVTLHKLGYVRRLHQFGMRGYGEPEPGKKIAEVTRLGIDQFRQSTLEALLAGMPDDVPYYVTIDIDVLDPTFAPSTGTPVPGGMFPHELKNFLYNFAKARRVLGADVVEVATHLGSGDGTAHHALDALLCVASGIVDGLAQMDDAEQDDTGDPK